MKNIATQVEQLPPTSQTQSFLTTANALLVVPSTIVTSKISFTRQSTDLANFRQQVADAIAQGDFILNPPPSIDGDVDGDLDVDGDDCAIVQAAMDTVSGDAGFVAEADFNADGAITCEDGVLWLSYYRSYLGNPSAADPCGVTSDSDGDGVPDCIDQCPGTPVGVEVGANGCPPPPPGDLDGDQDVDMDDFGYFQACLSGKSVAQTKAECQNADLDDDGFGDVDIDDLSVFLGCMSGANIPADASCAD